MELPTYKTGWYVGHWSDTPGNESLWDFIPREGDAYLGNGEEKPELANNEHGLIEYWDGKHFLRERPRS